MPLTTAATGVTNSETAVQRRVEGGGAGLRGQVERLRIQEHSAKTSSA